MECHRSVITENLELIRQVHPLSISLLYTATVSRSRLEVNDLVFPQAHYHRYKNVFFIVLNK